MAVVIDDEIEVAFQSIRAALGDVGTASDDDLSAVVGSCGRVRSWLAAVEASCLGEVRRRKGDAVAVAAGAQRASARKARAAARRSKLVDELPGVGDALAGGAIDEDHVDALGSVRAEHRDALANDMGLLLDHASKVDADAFRQRVRRWQLEQERESGESELERQRKNRKGSVSTRTDDGMGVFRFELDPVTAARVESALAQRSEKLWRDDNNAKGARRSPGQRMADAFTELVCAGGTGNGVDTTIMIVADIDTLRSGVGGRCELLDGTPVPVDEVRKMALSARLLPAIFDVKGNPLWVGRSSRLPTSAQRAAIAARDRGCTVPGCDTPIGWCQVHHIVWWSRGGATDLDNLTTVCSRHHHMIHEEGWQIRRNRAGDVDWRGPP